MQFSIPKWETIASFSSSVHQVFHIHLNGFLHCKTRYSQLLDLHTKLKSSYPELIEELGAKFPPRHLMVLNTSDLESRRDKLETYLQTLSQCIEITTGPELTSFLLRQQTLTFSFSEEQQPLPVTLPDFSSTMLNLSLGCSSVAVLLSVAEALDIPKDCLFAFKLVLIELQGKVLIYHKLLLSCECPALVLIAAKQERSTATFAILLRKMLSCRDIERQMVENAVVAKLVADEIRQDLKYSFCLPRDLKSTPKAKLLEKSDQLLLRSLNKIRYCGYIRFQVCAANFPEERTYVVPRFGRYEVCLEFNKSDGLRVCASFEVSRIKCWSVGELTEANAYRQFSYRYELCFEYYLARDKAYIVKILTNEAVMMSLCIQQMIDEMSLINAQKGIDTVVLSDDYEIQIDEIKSEEDNSSSVSMSTVSSNDAAAAVPSSFSAPGQDIGGASQYDLLQSLRESASWQVDDRKSIYPSLTRLKGSLSKENVTFERANFDCDL